MIRFLILMRQCVRNICSRCGASFYLGGKSNLGIGPFKVLPHKSEGHVITERKEKKISSAAKPSDFSVMFAFCETLDQLTSI